jgi:hypothetical protein
MMMTTAPTSQIRLFMSAVLQAVPFDNPGHKPMFRALLPERRG